MGQDGYRGHERRRAPDPGVGRGTAAGVVILTVAVAVALLVGGRAGWSADGGAVPALHAAVVPTLLMAAVVAFTHWRVVGWAHGLRAAVGLGALVLLAMTEIVASGAQGSATVRAAVLTAAAISFLRAVRGHEVDTRATPAGELGAMFATFLLAGLVATAVRALVPASNWPAMVLVGAAAGVAAGVGGVAVVVALRRAWTLLFFTAWALVAVGIGQLAGPTVGVALRGTLVAALALGGASVAVCGGVVALARAADVRRGDTHGLFLDRRAAEADTRRHVQELAHEVRNGLLVVQGAASLLEASDGRPTDGPRDHPLAVLRAAVDHLQGVVVAPWGPDTVRAFRLDELVRDRVAAAAARGVAVEVRTPEPVEALGSPRLTTQAIDNVLLNAQRHGEAGEPDRPVTVVVGATSDDATVLVRDHGPGVAPGEREDIFAPGHQAGRDRSGDGIGLHLARWAMRAQHGDVVYVDSAARGAGFRLSLPRRRSSMALAGRPTADERHDGG